MPYVKSDIIRPAINTPSAIIGRLFLIRISRSAAISAPVQPPVPGRGMATKSKSPHYLYFSIEPFFLSERASSLSTILEKNFDLLITAKIFFIKSKINGIGSILPT